MGLGYCNYCAHLKQTDRCKTPSFIKSCTHCDSFKDCLPCHLCRSGRHCLNCHDHPADCRISTEKTDGSRAQLLNKKREFERKQQDLDRREKNIEERESSFGLHQRLLDVYADLESAREENRQIMLLFAADRERWEKEKEKFECDRREIRDHEKK